MITTFYLATHLVPFSTEATLPRLIGQQALAVTRQYDEPHPKLAVRLGVAVAAAARGNGHDGNVSCCWAALLSQRVVTVARRTVEAMGRCLPVSLNSHLIAAQFTPPAQRTRQRTFGAAASDNKFVIATIIAKMELLSRLSRKLDVRFSLNSLQHLLAVLGRLRRRLAEIVQAVLPDGPF